MACLEAGEADLALTVHTKLLGMNCPLPQLSTLEKQVPATKARPRIPAGSSSSDRADPPRE